MPVREKKFSSRVSASGLFLVFLLRLYERLYVASHTAPLQELESAHDSGYVRRSEAPRASELALPAGCPPMRCDTGNTDGPPRPDRRRAGCEPVLRSPCPAAPQFFGEVPVPPLAVKSLSYRSFFSLRWQCRGGTPDPSWKGLLPDFSDSVRRAVNKRIAGIDWRHLWPAFGAALRLLCPRPSGSTDCAVPEPAGPEPAQSYGRGTDGAA